MPRGQSDRSIPAQGRDRTTEIRPSSSSSVFFFSQGNGNYNASNTVLVFLSLSLPLSLASSIQEEAGTLPQSVAVTTAAAAAVVWLFIRLCHGRNRILIGLSPHSGVKFICGPSAVVASQKITVQ